MEACGTLPIPITEIEVFREMSPAGKKMNVESAVDSMPGKPAYHLAVEKLSAHRAR